MLSPLTCRPEVPQVPAIRHDVPSVVGLRIAVVRPE